MTRLIYKTNNKLFKIYDFVTYLIILHPDFDLKFRRHHKLISFNRVKDSWLVWILALIHLLLHLHLLLLGQVGIESLSVWTHLHGLLHLLLDHLLLAIHFLSNLLIVLVFNLLLLVHIVHGLGWSHFLVCDLVLLLLCGIWLIRLVSICSHHIGLVVLLDLVWLCVCHVFNFI